MPELTQAGDPHPKTPGIKAPPGACDTHVHLFGPTGKYLFASDSPYEHATRCRDADSPGGCTLSPVERGGWNERRRDTQIR
jgi:hypothetical protein